MKLIFLLVCGLGLLSSVAEKSYAQSTRLTFELKNASIKNVLEHIENSSEFSFMYDNTIIDVDAKVDFSAKDESIDVILDRLLVENIDYRVIGRHIVLFSSDKKTVETLSLQSQQPSVTGSVTDQRGLPLPGVTVLIKGTTSGTVTNSDGNFSLVVPQSAETLQFSFVGMRTQDVPIQGNTSFSIVMEEDFVGIEEVVAVGYGTMKKSDLTGSVSSARIADLQQVANVSIGQSLQGLVPGLNVGAVNAAGADPNITIRGATTISGSQEVLIVLDGIIFNGSLSSLNPNDIASVDVLKDASSTAIYGAQAANGVLLITTKKGLTDSPRINLSTQFATQNPATMLTPMNREEFL